MALIRNGYQAELVAHLVVVEEHMFKATTAMHQEEINHFVPLVHLNRGTMVRK